MIKLELEISEDDVAFDSFKLDGAWFDFSVALNETIDRYYFDLYSDGVLAIGGVVLNKNVELFIGHASDLIPKGALFLMGNSDEEPTKGSVGIGRTFNLFYIGNP